MDDMSGSAPDGESGVVTSATPVAANSSDEVVSTHVLVSRATAEKLRELSRRTRIAQSDFLREAVDDLLGKYGKSPTGK